MANLFRPFFGSRADALSDKDKVRLSSKDDQLQRFLKLSLGTQPVESMLVIFCDERGYYLTHEDVGWGGASTVELDLPYLLRRALIVGASSFLMAHNHPSGNCWPSDDDIRATRRVAHAADFVGLHVMDHLVVTYRDCYSMRAGAIL